MCANSTHAWMLSQTGYADQIKEKTNRTMAAANKLQHPQTMGFVYFWTLRVVHERGELLDHRDLVENQLAFNREQRLSMFFGWATFLKAQADSIDGRDAAEVERMLTIAAGLKEQFGLFNASYSLALIAAACADRGLKDKGLGACEQAFEFVEQTNERTYEAEIHRVNGLLLAPALGGDAEAAEACFVRALEVARSQSAKTLELRAANDLARMWHEHGRSEEARDMLEPVYGWFTEGFDTANLKTAKALLDELC